MKYLNAVVNSGMFEELKKNEYIEAYEELSIHTKVYKKDEIIFMEEDLINDLCIITAGSVRSEKVDADGEVHIIDLFVEDSIFALEIAVSKKKNATLCYIANEETTVIFISISSVEKSNYASKISKAFNFMLADDNIKLSHKIEILSERKLRDRIMAYLLILKKKSKDNTVSVRMSREQMAQFLCVNRSALSNELNKMKREGIIDFKGSEFIIKEFEHNIH